MKVSVPACLAEFVAMTLFVIIGCGTAIGVNGSINQGPTGSGDTSTDPAWVLEVSLAFGLAITVLAYTFGHFSGGHINCAVTFGLVLAGQCPLVQGIANFVAQMLGSVAGAGILCLIFPAANDHTGQLAANGLGGGVAVANALVGEMFGTFLLMFTVLQTACNPKSEPNRAQACLAIGLAVFCANLVLIPIDGCSINPTRSFGPAVVATARGPVQSGTRRLTEAPASLDLFSDMWIFWVGPLIGSGLAAGLYLMFNKLEPEGASYQVNDDEEGSDE
jgi:MIP family channel proteins